MSVSKLGPFAAAVLLAGLAGCSLPEVLPLVDGTTSGPSPYGPWYEQHWATNSVLLAAADEPNADAIPTDEEMDAALGPAMDNNVDATPGAAFENNGAAPTLDSTEFDNSSPFQFPSSAFNPTPEPGNVAPSSADLVPPTPEAPERQTAPGPGGPIRY